MTKAIRFHQTGGPEVLHWEDVEVGAPGAGQARVRHTAVGLNFIDTYHRSGLYPLPMPSGLGVEAAGVVEEVGPGVVDLKAGDRVAYGGGAAGAAPGAYAEARLIAADRLVKIPDGISDQQAAAMMLKGMTAEYLIRRTFPVQPGQIVLFHAAAGGVGLIAGQWLKALGAITIGTVGSDEKAALARAHGYDHTIVYTRENFTQRVLEITGGVKLPVVFGNGSGPVASFDLGVLAQKGSLYVTRPTLNAYTASREDLVASASALFDVVLSGKVRIEINQTYPLADVAQAHRDLEGRKTTGSTVLVP
jgi:NADPH2:quinone reductase